MTARILPLLDSSGRRIVRFGERATAGNTATQQQ
jgi:hypothetical protein